MAVSTPQPEVRLPEALAPLGRREGALAHLSAGPLVTQAVGRLGQPAVAELEGEALEQQDRPERGGLVVLALAALAAAGARLGPGRSMSWS